MLLVGSLIIFVPLAIASLILGIMFFKKAKKLRRIDLCSECGNKLNENDNICGKCGNPIPDVENKKGLYYIIVGISIVVFLYSCIRILRGTEILFNVVLS